MRLPTESYGAGEVIGNRPDSIAIVVSGSVQIYRVALDGREVSSSRLSAGDAYFLRDNLAITEETTVLQWLHVTRLKEMASAEPDLSRRIIESLADRLGELEKVIDDLAFRDSTQRTAALLLRLCEQQGVSESGECRLERRYTQRQLAEHAGMSRETLSRSLAVLRRTGIVDLDRRKVLIKDSEALKKLVA